LVSNGVLDSLNLHLLEPSIFGGRDVNSCTEKTFSRFIGVQCRLESLQQTFGGRRRNLLNARGKLSHVLKKE
jgi:hypothetical protein